MTANGTAPENAEISADTRGESALTRMKSTLAERRGGATMQAVEHDEPRNPLFEKLVEDENDTVGLLAYALYKQSKRDWLVAFRQLHGRPPQDAETQAFITGEQLPRRLATYRQLATQQLERLGASAPPPAVPEPASAAAMREAPKDMAMSRGMLPFNSATLRYLAIMTGLVVGMAIVFRVVASWLFGTGR